MSTVEVRERDLEQLRDIVASLHRRGSAAVTPPESPLPLASPDELSHDPVGPGIPWESLELLRDLLHVEWMYVHGMDSVWRHSFFHQKVGVDGHFYFLVQEPGPTAPVTRVTGFEEWMLDAETVIWNTYWVGPISHYERTGDWDASRSLDVVFHPFFVDWCRPRQKPDGHVITAAAPVGPSRHLQLLGVRDGRGSFTEREHATLEILRPHLMEAWRRSCASGARLTGSQRRVLELVREGHTNRQVARDLGITEATVRTHLQHAYTILGVNNRVAAVAAAFGNTEPGVFTG